jgi:hypothetical protein
MDRQDRRTEWDDAGPMGRGLHLCDADLAERCIPIAGSTRGRRWVDLSLLLAAAIAAGGGLRSWLVREPARAGPQTASASAQLDVR